MNPLLEITRTGILERDAFEKTVFPDKQILKAIEIYDSEGSSKRRAQSFVTMLTPLWEMYNKGSYVSIFQKFIELETGLETISPEHTSHVNHVIQEFLFGYNLLINCEYVKSKYHFDEGKNDPNSVFGEVFFSWMAASLLHDLGYDIQEAPEEEEFRKKKNEFWGFMTDRAVTTNSLTFDPNGPGQRIIEDYLLADVKNLLKKRRLSYHKFENYFKTPVPNSNWVRYDHGVISAVKYFIELEKLQGGVTGSYVNWPPNRQAALAMALHNFRYQDCDVRLRINQENTFIPYLLIASDEIQEWERERFDSDVDLPTKILPGKNAKKDTELVGITFGGRQAFLILNHRLKSSSLRTAFEEYLDEKIVLQKKHYPVRTIFREERDFRDVLREYFSFASKLVSSVPNPYTQFIGNFVQAMTADSNRMLRKERHTVKEDLLALRRKQRVMQTKQEKYLLVAEEPVYEVYTYHMIDQKPHVITVFSF